MKREIEDVTNNPYEDEVIAITCAPDGHKKPFLLIVQKSLLKEIERSSRCDSEEDTEDVEGDLSDNG